MYQKMKPEHDRRRKLSEIDKAIIKAAWQTGATVKELAEMWHIAKTTVLLLVNSEYRERQRKLVSEINIRKYHNLTPEEKEIWHNRARETIQYRRELMKRGEL